jgi:hypothetical protein
MVGLSSGDRPEPESSQARGDQAAGRLRAPLRIALALRRFVNHPVTEFCVGLILIVSGLIEAYDTVLDDLHHLRVRVGHGVVILGLVNLLASLPGVIEGIAHWLSPFEEREHNHQRQDGPDGGTRQGFTQ